MNILDFEFDFNMHVEYSGDNEIDKHTLEISRITCDANGNELCVFEKYDITTDALISIESGLESALRQIKKHLNQ